MIMVHILTHLPSLGEGGQNLEKGNSRSSPDSNSVMYDHGAHFNSLYYLLSYSKSVTSISIFCFLSHLYLLYQISICVIKLRTVHFLSDSAT